MSCSTLLVSHKSIIAAEFLALLILHAALVTRQLAHDLNIIGQEIEKLYGVLSEEDLKLQ